MTARADLRVLGLVPYPLDTAPSQRFRLEQWRPHLEASGLTLDLQPFADAGLMSGLYSGRGRSATAWGIARAFARRLRLLVHAGRYDVVVVHRGAALVGPAWIERALTTLRKPLVFDFDDAIFLLHTSARNRHLGWLKFPGKTNLICRISNEVVVGNTYLADYAGRFNRNVTIVPTSIDTDVYRPRPRSPREGVVVGWTGSATSQTHLEWFRPTLVALGQSCKFELRVHSDQRPSLQGVDFTWIPWSAANELDALAEFDIGIMPMPDDPWSRGKCSAKALLYMALAVPAICSPVGMNRELIRQGENGLLASTSAEWVEALSKLVHSPGLRDSLGRSGRRTVESQYCAKRSAERFGSVLRRAAGR